MHLIRPSAYAISTLLHVVAAFLLVYGYAFAEADLPPRIIRGCILVDSLDKLNPLSLLQGSTESEVDAFFGARVDRARVRPQAWCVRYKYSPRLSYTLLFRDGVAQSVRLTDGHYIPVSCEGILVRSVEVQAQDWFDPAPPPRTNRCGCPPWGASSCAAAAEQEDAPDEAQS
jgi:hypothetical protein